MSLTEIEVRTALVAAEYSLATGTAAMAEFQMLLIAGQWAAADAMRLTVIANVESYLDNLAAAYRKLEVLENGPPQR